MPLRPLEGGWDVTMEKLHGWLREAGREPSTFGIDARLNAAGKEQEIVGIELSALTAEYAWEQVDEVRTFRKMTLFAESNSRVAPASEVRRRLGKALDEEQPDVVAVPGWSETGALAGLQWCARTGVPAVVMSESTALDRERVPWKEEVKARIVQMCAAGLAGGKPQADYLTTLQLPRNRIFCGYDVVDNEYFARSAEEVRKRANAVRKQLELPERYFLACSRFILKKNIGGLLQAYASYRDRSKDPWKLVLVGDGPLRPEALQVRKALQLEEHVVFPGFKQYGELPAYYALANAFVHASTVEQWGLVVNEAMASGLPVLVSNRCGCAADLVEQGRNGFTFDPDKPTALARFLGEFAQGRYDLAAMGRASSEIIDHWSPATFAASLRAAARIAIESPAARQSAVSRLLLTALLHR